MAALPVQSGAQEPDSDARARGEGCGRCVLVRRRGDSGSAIAQAVSRGFDGVPLLSKREAGGEAHRVWLSRTCVP